MTIRVEIGDCREVLARLPDQSVHCCVTSPPYFGLRDYGTAKWDGGDPDCAHTGSVQRTAPPETEKQASNRGALAVASGDCRCGAIRVDEQIGLESTPDEYVAQMVAVFREVKRVLRDDGTVWLNLGDSYSSGGRTTQTVQTVRRSQVVDNKRKGATSRNLNGDAASGKQEYLNGTAMRPPVVDGLGSKQLLGIPWRVAFALQADGWYLRSDIIWHKPNPMPESVKDRPTKAHEYIFLLSKSPRYYYDAAAIAEKATLRGTTETVDLSYSDGASRNDNAPSSALRIDREQRNRRTVWTVPTSPYSGAHFATFPPALIEPCILAGCPEGGTVLDPFGGAGTTGLVADRLQRNALLIELNPDYAELARNRIHDDAPLFSAISNSHVTAMPNSVDFSGENGERIIGPQQCRNGRGEL